MKRVVTGGELTQAAMRPPDLVDAYLACVERDVRRFGLSSGGRVRGCPACGADDGDVAVERMGFTFRSCTGCRSLFVSPVPDEQQLALYRTGGEAERFRRAQMLPATANVRARHAWAPRARWVLSTAAARLGPELTCLQFGPDMPELRGLLLRSRSIVGQLGALEPGDDAKNADAVLAFDVLERTVDFSAALHRCRTALRPGGLLFVTTVSGEGFEVRVLRGRTRSLVPPNHLQLLSRAGWQAALARERFRLVEYSTPGELDVQEVAEVCHREPEVGLPPIIDELVRHDDDGVRHAFQEVLQQAGLSAHVQLVAEAFDE
jgi:hypothetical protein